MPDLERGVEAGGGEDEVVEGGTDVVAAELVGAFEGLGEWEGGCGAVDMDGGATGGGEELGFCYGEGEDVCDMG